MIQESKFLQANILKKLAVGTQGIALIDKPTGWTSHDVVNKVRRITGIKRVGHAGTLDPLATGLLIVLIGRDFTKLQDVFMKQEKEYLVTGAFGVTTDSYDSDGVVVAVADQDKILKIHQVSIESAMPTFVGSISQQVPLFSAVKLNGKKLYQHARKKRDFDELSVSSTQSSQQSQNVLINEQISENVGKMSASPESPNFPTPPYRDVHINEFVLLDWLMIDVIDEKNRTNFESYPRATFRIQCSSGTYVRSLIHDLGEKIGVGATVLGLRRTKIGTFAVENSILL